jgi:hypothetical protein
VTAAGVADRRRAIFHARLLPLAAAVGAVMLAGCGAGAARDHAADRPPSPTTAAPTVPLLQGVLGGVVAAGRSGEPWFATPVGVAWRFEGRWRFKSLTGTIVGAQALTAHGDQAPELIVAIARGGVPGNPFGIEFHRVSARGAESVTTVDEVGVNRVAFADGGDGVVYALTDTATGMGSNALRSVLTSRDGGATWADALPPAPTFGSIQRVTAPDGVAALLLSGSYQVLPPQVLELKPGAEWHPWSAAINGPAGASGNSSGRASVLGRSVVLPVSGYLGYTTQQPPVEPSDVALLVGDMTALHPIPLSNEGHPDRSVPYPVALAGEDRAVVIPPAGGKLFDVDLTSSQVTTRVTNVPGGVWYLEFDPGGREGIVTYSAGDCAVGPCATRVGVVTTDDGGVTWTSVYEQVEPE